MDGTQNRLEQSAIRVQRGMSLLQEKVDSRDNLLAMAQSPDVADATWLSIMHAKTKNAITEAQRKVIFKKTFAEDS
jgi:hypothetical protein